MYFSNPQFELVMWPIEMDRSEGEKIIALNLEKVCRVCLNESDEMHSLFSKSALETDSEDAQEESICIYEILMNISSLKIAIEDGLPSLICTNCMNLALVSYKFQLQCNRSQDILDAYLAQVSNDSIHSDISQTNQDKDLTITFNTVEETLLDFSSLSDQCDDNDDTFEEDVTVTQNLEIIDENEQDDDDMQEEEDKSDLLNHVFIEDDESVLDAAKVVASEDNMKLKERLALKRRMYAENGGLTVLKRREPRRSFSYYIKEIIPGEKVYACNFCEKTYKYSTSLKIHLRTHTSERPYVCSICGKNFNHYGSLMYHHRSHTGEQPYSCKICGKKYKQSGTLTAHMRVHTGQRPYLCSVCGRGFRQAPDLNYHMRTHTKEKPYMCNVCGKTMSMQCHLVQHMRTHTGERPFKCSECTKAFPSSTRLKRHAIIHTGLKPFKCDVCDKSFNRRSSLLVHKKIHTEERPHVCPVCSRGFIQAHALKSHVLTHIVEN